MTQFTNQQKERALRLIVRFESGSEAGNPAAVAVLNDGAGISYGAFQFTHRSGLLAECVGRYLDLGGSAGGEILRRYLPSLRRRGPANVSKLAADRTLIAALRLAGTSPEMQRAQRDIAERRLLAPAVAEACRLGFATALGLAVVLDSITHGSWERISEKAGIDNRTEPEADRIIRYLETRQRWLLSSKRLRPTVYRTAALLGFARLGNLELNPRFSPRPKPSLPEIENSSAAVASPESAELPAASGGNFPPDSAAIQPATADEVPAGPQTTQQPMKILRAADRAASEIEGAFAPFDRADRLIEGVLRRSSRLRSAVAAAAASIWQALWAAIGFFAGLPTWIWLAVAIICLAITLFYLYRQIVPARLSEGKQ